MTSAKPVPEGASVVMPMLVCRDAGAELDFCKTTFDAVERVSRPGPDGAVAHALVTIGGAMVMIEAEPVLGRSHRSNHGSSRARLDHFRPHRGNDGEPEARAVVEDQFSKITIVRLRVLFAAVAVACACFTTSPSAERQQDIARVEIDDGRQWFEPGAELKAASSAIRRGAMAAAFNQPYAESILKTVIQWQPESDAANQAQELLSRIYVRTGQYRRLIENLDLWAGSFPNRSEVQKEKADVEQFRGLPDQRNGESRASTLAHDPGDDWSVPITINGKPAKYLLDTGAWLSVMTESEARRLGLAIRSGSAKLSESAGKGIVVRTAIARSVVIGAMQFQDVSFAILPGEGDGGILGMPIILALGQVKWSNRGTWELAGRSESGGGTPRNVVFSENRLLLATSVTGTRVFGTLDTGAVDTDLNETFAMQFPDVVQSGTKQSRDITGVGGTVSVASVAVPEVFFQIGTARAVLRPAHVTLQRITALGGSCCIGNIGRDLLAQTGEFTLNLSEMTLRLR